MKRALSTLIATLIASSMIALSGCGSILATMQVDTIEDEPVERTMGQMIEDDNSIAHIMPCAASVRISSPLNPTSNSTS